MILRDQEAADAVQDALLEGWLDIRALRDAEGFVPWLDPILVHACYREAARYRRRRSLEIDVDAIDATGHPRDGHEVAMRDATRRHRSELVARRQGAPARLGDGGPAPRAMN